MNSFKELFNTNPKYSTVLAFIFGYILIDDLTSDEQDMLGSWLMLVAQVLVTNANSQTLIEDKVLSNQININSKNAKSLYNPLIYNIDKLKDIIKVLYPNQTIDLSLLSNYLDSIKTKIDNVKID